MNELISVILAVKNGQDYIEDTIESVLGQSYTNFELIIIINCSSDETLNIVKNVKDSRVTYYETNISQLSFNLNYGILKAKGDYIARIDADDLAFKYRLEKQLSILKKYNYDVVGSNIQLIDEKGLNKKSIVLPENNSEIRSKIFYRSVIAHPSVLMKKSSLLKHSCYLGGKFAQDYDLWLRLMRDKDIKFYNVQEPLTKYRIHSKQSKGNPYSYAEVAGYLFKESIYSKSFRYFIGSFIYYFKACFIKLT